MTRHQQTSARRRVAIARSTRLFFDFAEHTVFMPVVMEWRDTEISLADEPRVLTIAQVARILNSTKPSVHNLIKDNVLRSAQINGVINVLRCDLEDYLERSRPPRSSPSVDGSEEVTWDHLDIPRYSEVVASAMKWAEARRRAIRPRERPRKRQTTQQIPDERGGEAHGTRPDHLEER